MSHSHHDDAEAEAHDAHAHAAPVEEPDEAPGEPKTPPWLTALGGALFLGLGIFWLASRPADKTLSELSPPAPAPSASQAQAAPPPPPPPPAPPPAPEPVVAPRPSATAATPQRGAVRAVHALGKPNPTKKP
jgi:hypothetical protein